MDSPARSSWLNMKQYNGYSGCNTCTEPGEQLDLGPGKKNARRQCHIYPFNPQYAQTTGHAKLREHAVVKQQALFAMSQISQKGKVAVSILVNCSFFEMYMYKLFLECTCTPGGGGGAHGYFWVGMCRPRHQIGTPFKKKFALKLILRSRIRPKTGTPF